MISKEKKERLFELNLEKDLKELGYLLKNMAFEKDEEENFYSILLNGNIVIYFDEYKFFNPIISFFNKGIPVSLLTKPEKINILMQSNYLRAKHDEKKLEEYKTKIRHLLELEPNLKITKIAEELGITRQAIYKNLELKKFIDSLKK